VNDALTEDEAAAVAHVTVETIRKWVQRGHLKPRKGHDGRRLYHEGDVLRAELATRRTARLRLLLTKAIEGLPQGSDRLPPTGT
jgi:DNA-binding transcriptional MerR regulator